MVRLRRLLLTEFFPVFLTSLLFFVLILEMVDLFTNLWRYLTQEVPFSAVALIQLLYLPKCISFAIPIALLFSISYTIGDFHGKNQLIAVLGAGISLYRFIFPLVGFGFFLSFFSFFFQERVVIDTFQAKNELFRTVLNTSTSFSNTNVTILGDDVRRVYHAEYYNDETQTLVGVLIIGRDSEGNLEERFDAESAEWKNTYWELKNARIFTRVGNEFREEKHTIYQDFSLNTPPLRFRRMTKTVDEMKVSEAKEWIESLRKAGLSYREALTEYYKRYSFAAASLVVSLFSGIAGAQFRKNILLMSLLTSLVISVLYYVTQMVMVLLAKLGYIAPAAGAWAAFVLFLCFGFFWIRLAKL
jgi:lipopolysaccharide export system permease protein